MKHFLKQAAITGGLEVISRLRADLLFPKAAGRGLIFTLHHVRPKTPLAFDPNAHLEVTPDYLEKVLQHVKQAGLVPIRLEDLPERLADPSDSRRFVCFTLDDGYRNNALHAAPLFRRHGVPYTIFVTPGFVNRSVTLWWETAAMLIGKSDVVRFDFGAGEEALPTATHRQKHEAFQRICNVFGTGDQAALTLELDRSAAQSGISATRFVEEELMDADELKALAGDTLASFGGHTMTHPMLSRLPEEAMIREIRQSIDEVAALTSRAVTSFAYPYGFASSAGEREYRAVRDAGITLAVTTRPGMLDGHTLEQPMAVSRVSLNGLYQKPHYIPALLSGLPFKMSRLT